MCLCPLFTESAKRVGHVGKEHNRIRSVMMKTMSPSAAANYIPYIAEAAERCLKAMAEADGAIDFQYHVR